MNAYSFNGVAIARADVMSWPSHVAGSAAAAAHPPAARHDAITAPMRRTAAGTVASVNRGII